MYKIAIYRAVFLLYVAQDLLCDAYFIPISLNERGRGVLIFYLSTLGTIWVRKPAPKFPETPLDTTRLLYPNH